MEYVLLLSIKLVYYQVTLLFFIEKTIFSPCYFSIGFSQDLFRGFMISELSKVILPSHEDRFPEVLRECPTLGVAHLVHPHVGPGELSRHTQPPPAETGLGAVHHHP